MTEFHAQIRTPQMPFPKNSTLEVGNSKLSNPQAIATALNNCFSTVGSNIANSIPILQTRFETFLNAPLCHSFVLFPASIIEIEDDINNLNSSKSPGLFSIPTKLLETLRFLLSGPLAYLFNCSISSGVVPDKLKIASVIQVHKADQKLLSQIIDPFHCSQYSIKFWKN